MLSLRPGGHHGPSARARVHPHPRRLRHGPAPAGGRPVRRRRRGPARLDDAELLAETKHRGEHADGGARPSGQPGDRGRRRRLPRRGGEHRRDDHGSQHVRTRARRVARRELARVVGRGPAVPPRRVRPDPPRPALARDGRRHPLPRGHPDGGPGPRDRGRRRKDVRLGGGVATVRAFLAEGLVDELDLVVAPILAGAGERLFEGLHDLPAGYRVDALVPGESGVVHARVVRR
ncbi:dihydrofolate reductase family protein [Actinomycetospora rhizophila]|uniref:Dihydrofolate reductase family protein n=1 Tax=Actinomycetospora rhizophila TaxID=1416876 RepID=A0ABV9ZGQ6_9PSEU